MYVFFFLFLLFSYTKGSIVCFLYGILLTEFLLYSSFFSFSSLPLLCPGTPARTPHYLAQSCPRLPLVVMVTSCSLKCMGSGGERGRGGSKVRCKVLGPYPPIVFITEVIFTKSSCFTYDYLLSTFLYITHY